MIPLPLLILNLVDTSVSDAHKFACPIDFDLSYGDVALCLHSLRRLDLEAIDGALDFARCARDHLVAHSAAACKTDFRVKHFC